MTFLELSLSGAVFVLAIAAFRALALRRLPKGTFVALWWLAAARLLLPLELSSRFSVYTLLETLRPQTEAPAAPIVPTAPAVPMVPAAPSPVTVLPSQPYAAAAQPVSQPFPIWTALWLTVGLLLAAWFLIRYVRWRRRFREALPVDCPSAWFQLRRKVEVRISDQIAAPLTYGLLRPVILLPKTMNLADGEALTCVLAHELAHIRRFDGLLKLALTASLCLHWFNPAVWLMVVLGNRDMELRCDEAAVLALGEDSRERYALVLIRLAENQTQHVPLCGFSHKSGMEERIKAIMSIKKKSLLACAVALAMVLSITTAFATSPKPTEPAKADVQTTLPAKEPEAPAPAKKPETTAPVKTPEASAPAEKPEEPAPEKVEAPPPEPEAPKAAAETGTPFYAAGKGTVIETGTNAQDGNFIRIQHSQSMETFYAHCASVLVKTGDAVEVGQTIATVGGTGPRFRFEFLVNGIATDSVAYSYERHSHIGNGVTGSMGVYHGEDYSYLGNPIVAIQDGTVLAAGVKNYGGSGERGPYVQIQFQSGYSISFYCCEKVLVKTGDSVKTGDVIAYAGAHGIQSTSSPQQTESEFEIEASWKEWADENLVNGDYPRNSRGETYGTTGGLGYLGYLPDLIAVAVPYTHEEGYVTNEDMHYPPYDPENPDLSNAFDNWWEENHFTGLVLPMYDSEHNQIGTWVANGGPGKTVTIEEARAAQEKGFPNANGSQFIDRGPHYDTVEEARAAALNGEI